MATKTFYYQEFFSISILMPALPKPVIPGTNATEVKYVVWKKLYQFSTRNSLSNKNSVVM